jgi:uncharacterized protein
MGDLTELDGAALARVVDTYREALRNHQEELNRLNVYPVPDGDTGTNMALTLESVCAEVGESTAMADVCTAMAHGSLMGARGNSGVILSQILRGLADTFRPLDAITAADVAAGLRRASDAAYQAVMRPVEGTILTVVRASADAAESARGTLEAVLEHSIVAAVDAVDRTPDLLPVLKEAGVVDAGGRGFALLLDAFLYVVTGRPVPEPVVVAESAAIAAHEQAHDLSSLRYEVMFFLDADEATIPGFKQSWSAIGDSIVVTGGDGLWNCHVHTNDVGAAIEAGVKAGRPRDIRVTDLLEQVEDELRQREKSGQPDDSGHREEAWVLEATTAVLDPAEMVVTGVVAVAVGEGLQRLLKSVGVHVVVAGGQSMNPSTAQILEAVQQVPAASVIVLPNNKNIIPVAEQVDGLSDRAIGIVPTHAVVEALAALVAYDPDAPLDANLKLMRDAAAHVQAGEVTQAVRDTNADCGPIAKGDWIALSTEGILVAADSVAAAATGLLDRLVDAESELVTVLVGEDALPADTTRVRQHLGLEHPHVEVEVHAGDQPLYPFLFGVE